MKRNLTNVLIAIFISSAGLAAQYRYEFNGLFYTFPASQGRGLLTNDGAGNLSWVSSFPTDLLVWSTSGACPAGWAEYIPARGRYVVGLVAGGTNGAQVGVALSPQENRAAPLHNHSASIGISFTSASHNHNPLIDPGHNHIIPALRGATGAAGSMYSAGVIGNVGSSTTGVTLDFSSSGAGLVVNTNPVIDGTGAPGGTSAPYVQLYLCRRVP
jgi:hypothetical protein